MNEEEIIISQDEKQLAGLGYRQDFKRELNPVSYTHLTLPTILLV